LACDVPGLIEARLPQLPRLSGQRFDDSRETKIQRLTASDLREVLGTIRARQPPDRPV